LARGHRPVLVDEVVALLSAKASVIDATVGAGGHAEALLEAGVGSIVGVDRDRSAVDEAAARLARFGPRFRAVHTDFSRLGEVAAEAGARHVGGVLFDLGVSSMQLDRAERGFGYRSAGPLDMRMDPDRGITAAEVVNTYPEDRLAHVIAEFGEERFARRIAGAIARARAREPIGTTEQLAAIVAGAVPRRRGGAHPARRTFQAIRIEVNRELEEISASLPQAADLLEPGGRVVVLAYHSLEDRIVKRFIVGNPSLRALTKKPARASEAETAANPRARSVRLRAAERFVEDAA
jgi:16S rRNA (cytosine1402-N4)-methyltransferase